ncbi:MAG: helix-turn-helix domain-containing protein [Planctomycetota bacterium]
MTFEDLDVKLASILATLSEIEERLEKNRVRHDPPAVMTTQELADYIGMSVDRLHQFRCYGGGPKFVQPTQRIVRYRRADVDEWLETPWDGQKRG